MIMLKKCMNIKETSIINKLLKYNMHKTMDKLMARTRLFKIMMKKKKAPFNKVTFLTNIWIQTKALILFLMSSIILMKHMKLKI